MKYELRDFNDAEIVGIQVSPEGHRVWVCVDGACILRVVVKTGKVEIRDMRKKGRPKK